MKTRYFRLDILTSLICLIGVATVLAVWLGNGRVVQTLTAEDGIVETLSAVFYFFGFVVCICRIVKKSQRKRFWLFFWAFLCFVFMGEEISWCQRFFGYSTPSFFENASAQKEFNIHNLELLQGGKWVEAFSSRKFDLKMFLSSQNIFRIGFICYFLLIPLLFYAGKPKFFVRFLKDKTHYPLPRVGFLISVWATLCLSFVLAIHSNETIRSSLAETREMFYALFILVYIYMYLKVGVKERCGATVAVESDSFGVEEKYNKSSVMN